MRPSRSYKDLIVWQEAMAIVAECYHLTREFPRAERFGMTAQLHRAAISIPANIAEGRARANAGEFRYHVGVARGSLAELETFVELARRLGFTNDPTVIRSLTGRGDRLSRMLNRLHASLTRQLAMPRRLPNSAEPKAHSSEPSA